jgi:hypothetical protein
MEQCVEWEGEAMINEDAMRKKIKKAQTEPIMRRKIWEIETRMPSSSLLTTA